MTTFNIGIDWRRKGLICWEARPGDALNILPRPLTYSTIEYRKTSVVSSAVLELMDTIYSIWGFTVQTGTGVNNGLVLGQSDAPAVSYIPVSASSPYGVAVWVKGQSGYGGVPFILRVKDQAGTTLFTSAPFILSADWQQVSVTGSTGASSTHIYIEVIKNNDAANVTFQAAGFMLVAGNVVPTGYNAGETADLYDNVTERVINADWFLGMKTPYQEIAGDSVLKLSLNNSDKRFSPEYSSSPLYGNLAPYRPVKVQSDDEITLRTHWTGWLEGVQPAVNQEGERTAEITAAGPGLFFAEVETGLELQENKRTDEIVSALLGEVPIAPALTQATILDVAEYAELGETTYLADTTITNSVEAGKTTLAYAADNWVWRGSTTEQEHDTFNVYRAIKDTVAAERGRFFFDRDGQAVFWNRHHLILNQSVAATFDNTMTDLSYEYAGLGEFKNEVIVTCHPRTVSASANELLWQLDKPIRLQPGETRKVGASYRDDSDNRIGGKEVTHTNVTFSEGDATVRLIEIGANKATLEIINKSQSQPVVVATCEVRGRKITDFGSMEASSLDGTSIAFYGKRTLKMNLPSIDNLDFAQDIAHFERARRAQPMGKVKTMMLKSHGVDGGGQHAEQLARTIGDLIRIQEAQTAHDDTYFIIGEAHRLSKAGTLFETTWYLESATEGDWFIVDTSKLDEAVLAY